MINKKFFFFFYKTLIKYNIKIINSIIQFNLVKPILMPLIELTMLLMLKVKLRIYKQK